MMLWVLGIKFGSSRREHAELLTPDAFLQPSGDLRNVFFVSFVCVCLWRTAVTALWSQFSYFHLYVDSRVQTQDHAWPAHLLAHYLSGSQMLLLV